MACSIEYTRNILWQIQKYFRTLSVKLGSVMVIYDMYDAIIIYYPLPRPNRWPLVSKATPGIMSRSNWPISIAKNNSN
jgi:hypothetical protein